MSHLGETHLGYLIQLPPQMTIKTLSRVVQIAKFNKEKYLNVHFFIEFRHASWFTSETYSALAGLINIVFVNQYGVSKEMSLGFSPSLDAPVKNEITMFRCHGPWTSQAYCGNYSDEDLCLIASMKPDIVAFDNTDSFQFQLEVELPGNQCAFSSEANFVDQILPSAVADALRLKGLIN